MAANRGIKMKRTFNTIIPFIGTPKDGTPNVGNKNHMEAAGKRRGFRCQSPAALRAASLLILGTPIGGQNVT